MNFDKVRNLSGLSGKRAFLLALLVALSTSFSVWFSQPVEAEISVKKGLRDETIQVQIIDGTIRETVEEIGAHFNIPVTGEFSSSTRITASLSGTLKQVMEKLFGSSNFLLVYNGSRIEKLAVLGGALDVFSNIAGNDATPSQTISPPSTTAPVSDVAGGLAKLSQIQFSQFSPEKSRQSRINQAQEQSAQNAQPKLDGKGVPSSALVRSLQTTSAQNLMGLVKALKALCQPGQSC